MLLWCTLTSSYFCDIVYLEDDLSTFAERVLFTGLHQCVVRPLRDVDALG